MNDATDDLLEFGRQILASQPFSVHVGAELIEFSQGRAALRIPVTPELRQQHGFVHGGVISYAIDNVLTFAGGSVLGTAVVTSEYKVNYLRPVTGGQIVASATVIHSGKNQAVCRCDVYAEADEKRHLCAAGQGTITKIGPKPKAGRPER